MTKPHILLIDNFDSFSFNLVDAFGCLGADVEVFRNSITASNALSIAAERNTALVVLSPGPGSPTEAGCCIDLIRQAAGRWPIFGVCLGHQALVSALGGSVGPAGAIVHGKKSRVRHFGHPLFSGLPEEFEVGRYHSLAAFNLPDELISIAESCGLNMAIAHRRYPIYGVQFHPESILTTLGQTIVANVYALARQSVSPGAKQ